MRRPFRAKYTLDELTAITDEWEAWQGLKSHINILVRCMDVENALKHLGPVEREAVFLVGICQLTIREAAEVTDVYPMKMWRRYQRGLEAMAHYLNGG